MGKFDDVDRFEAALRLEVREEMARKKNGMSKSDLSRLSGISTSQISRLLSDERRPGRTDRWTVGVIVGIATALDLTPVELTERAQRRYLEEEGREGQ